MKKNTLLLSRQFNNVSHGLVMLACPASFFIRLKERFPTSGNDKLRYFIVVILKLLTVLFFFFFSIPYSEAFSASIFPNKISPGDAFVIRVSDVSLPDQPTAFFEKTELLFSECGKACFIALGAVDIDKKPGVYKLRINAGKKKKVLSLSVKRIKFPEISLTLPEDKVSLSQEDQERADNEALRLKALWQVKTGRLWEGNFIYPVDNNISTIFGVKRVINKKKTSIHRGIDIRGKDGEIIRASNTGRVVLSEDLFFGGNTIILDHGQGIYTIYMHLSVSNVKPEDTVAKGNIIGFVGSSGRASGPHLHFGVKVLDINTNPVSLMGLNL